MKFKLAYLFNLILKYESKLKMTYPCLHLVLNFMQALVSKKLAVQLLNYPEISGLKTK